MSLYHHADELTVRPLLVKVKIHDQIQSRNVNVFILLDASSCKIRLFLEINDSLAVSFLSDKKNCIKQH